MRCIDCDCCHEEMRERWNALLAKYERVFTYYCWGVPEPFEIKNLEKECTEYPEKNEVNSMPIVEKDGDVRIEYHIPEHIKSAIPEDFYLVFLGFILGTLGMPVKIEIGEYLCYMGGTAGWNKAFARACALLNLPWLKEYYDDLEWYDSDLFDGEIADDIERRIP